MWAKSQTQQQNPALLLRIRIPQSNAGQVAHVQPTPRVASQKIDITRRTPGAARWLSNTAKSHPCLGLLNSRVLRSCMVPQCSYPPHWHCMPSTTPCELWLDACVLHQRTTFLFLQASNLLSFVAKELHILQHALSWSLYICFTQRSPAYRVRMHGVSSRDTHFCPPHNSSVHLYNSNIRAAHWADHQWKAEWLDNLTKLRTFISDTGTRVLPGLKFFVRSRPAPAGVWEILPAPADL